MSTQSWKQLERDTAKVLGGKRIWRASFSEINVDVNIPDFPSFKVDSKRRKKTLISTLYYTTKGKYCKNITDEVVLVTRDWGKHPLATISLKLLGKFMDFVRKHKGQHEFH